MTRASLVVVALLAAAIAICSSCASLDSQFIPDQTFEGLGYWKYGFDDKLLYSLHWHGDTVRVRDGYGDNPDTFTIIASNCAGLNNAMSQLLRDVNTSVAAITDTTPRPPADEILLDSPLHKLVYQPLRRLDRLELSGFEEIPLQAWIKATESMRKIVRDCRAWMEPIARTIDAAKKYVVSSSLDRVDWNAELVRGDLGKAVQQLKRESGKGLYVAGVKLPPALTELGLIDEYEFVVHPRLAGHGPELFAGLSKHVDLKLVSRLELGSGAVAMRYEPRR